MEEFSVDIEKAREYSKTSNYKDAVSCYRKALGNIPQNCTKEEKIKFHEEFADLLHMQHKFAEAEDNYEKCIPENKEGAILNEDEVMRYLKLGITIAKQGRFIDAKAVYLEVLEKYKPLPTDSSADFEINEYIALIYKNLAEVAYFLCEKKEERRYRSNAKNIELTLATIEQAKKDNIPTGHIIRRYVRPCTEEVERKYKDTKVYKMSKGKRGYCLIVNNREFKDNKRDGSEIDEVNLENVFKQLNFEVTIVRNIAAMKLPPLVGTWVDKSENDYYGAFVLVVMSHGSKKNEILDSDYNAVLLHEICKKLYMAPLLSKKPRVVIVQACKGNDCNNAGQESSISLANDDPTAGKTGDIGIDSKNIDPKPSSENQNQCSTDDCCIMNATYDGFVAYRDPNKGSPFIAAVTEALFLYSHEKHMKEIINEVKTLMKYKEGKQKPDLDEWFDNKEFYLFPAFDGDD